MSPSDLAPPPTRPAAGIDRFFVPTEAPPPPAASSNEPEAKRQRTLTLKAEDGGALASLDEAGWKALLGAGMFDQCSSIPPAQRSKELLLNITKMPHLCPVGGPCCQAAEKASREKKCEHGRHCGPHSHVSGCEKGRILAMKKAAGYGANGKKLK